MTRLAKQATRPPTATLPAELGAFPLGAGALPLGAGALTDAPPALPLRLALSDGVMGPIGPPDPVPIVGSVAEGIGMEMVPEPLGRLREMEPEEMGEMVGIGRDTADEPLFIRVSLPGVCSNIHFYIPCARVGRNGLDGDGVGRYSDRRRGVRSEDEDGERGECGTHCRPTKFSVLDVVRV